MTSTLDIWTRDKLADIAGDATRCRYALQRAGLLTAQYKRTLKAFHDMLRGRWRDDFTAEKAQDIITQWERFSQLLRSHGIVWDTYCTNVKEAQEV